MGLYFVFDEECLLIYAKVDIVIYTVGGERTFITFTGIGFDPAVMGPTMMVTDSIKDPLPKRQAITVPEQVVLAYSFYESYLP